MDKLKKESLIDELLIFMNEEIETSGNIISCVRFDFSEQGEDSISFMNASGVSYQEVDSVLNICLSRKYLKYSNLAAGKNNLNLTDTGQGRAISADAAKHAPRRQESAGINIVTLNTNAPAQFGNHNTQNIENIFLDIIEKIDQTNASDAEKEESKNKLKAFLEHPLTNTALGLTPTFIQAIFGAK